MTVYLVGAGPGDPALLTLRAAELLARADVVVHDRLVDLRVLAMVPGAARRVDVGKRPGGARSALVQSEINALLIELGRRHRVVVRLKGGDPFVLGRGGEEALACAAAGIECEVVPGISSAIAVAAYAGVPVTHRGLASGFAVVSGHDAHLATSAIDWVALAASRCTIVVLMAASARAAVARRLLDAGRAADTPVLVVERGTTPSQRSRRTHLAELGALEVENPATIIIGEVAGIELPSYEGRPLFGWRVVVTRPDEQADYLVAQLAELGAAPLRLPVIEIGPPADGGSALRAAAGRLGEYGWIVLTSANGVGQLCALLRDARAFGRARVAAIGSATAAALRRFGIVADLVPERYVGESLVEAFPAPPAGGRDATVLIARAAVARDVVPDGLRALGWNVDVVDAYATRAATLSVEELAAIDDADAVMFTSPSTVAAFLELAGARRLPPVVASIGPVTSAAARSAGLTVDVEADEHTAAGLVDALTRLARTGRRPGVERAPR